MEQAAKAADDAASFHLHNQILSVAVDVDILTQFLMA